MIIDVVNLDSKKANFPSVRHTHDKRINSYLGGDFSWPVIYPWVAFTCLDISERPPLSSVCAQGTQTHFIKQPQGLFERRQDIN